LLQKKGYAEKNPAFRKLEEYIGLKAYVVNFATSAMPMAAIYYLSRHYGHQGYGDKALDLLAAAFLLTSYHNSLVCGCHKGIKSIFKRKKKG